MAQRPKYIEANDTSARVALIGLSMGIMCALTFGWYKLFKPPEAWFLQAVAGVGAFAISAFAIWMGKLVASERLAERRDDGTTPFLGFWLVPCLILLGLSALGTLNTLFIWGEGDKVRVESMNKLTKAITDMEATVNRRMKASEEVIRLQEKYRQLQDGLRATIVNETGASASTRSCGIGNEARGYMQSLEDLLIFKFPTGSFRTATQDCSAMVDHRKTAAAIEKLTKEKLDSHPLIIQGRVMKLEKEKEIVLQNLAKAKTALETARTSLKAKPTVATSINPAATPNAVLQDGLIAWENAATAVREFGRDVKKEELETPDLTTAENLGSIFHIFETIGSRLDRVSTYVYFVGAVLADLFLVQCWRRVLVGGASPGKPVGNGRPESAPRARVGEDIRHLWHYECEPIDGNQRRG